MAYSNSVEQQKAGMAKEAFIYWYPCISIRLCTVPVLFMVGDFAPLPTPTWHSYTGKAV